MCDTNCIEFVRSSLEPSAVSGKKVLEIGALNVNGSSRAVVEQLRPAQYVGVDIVDGPGVDVVCSADQLIDKFGPLSFDVVISTEMLEHVFDWRRVISNMKGVLRPGGTLVLTTRRIGFAYHGYPNDFWRYEKEDFEFLFGDMDIRRLICDDSTLGIFISAVRPVSFVERDMETHQLYSILIDRRVRGLSAFHVRALLVGRRMGEVIYPFVGRFRNVLPAWLRVKTRFLFVRH